MATSPHQSEKQNLIEKVVAQATHIAQHMPSAKTANAHDIFKEKSAKLIQQVVPPVHEANPKLLEVMKHVMFTDKASQLTRQMAAPNLNNIQGCYNDPQMAAHMIKANVNLAQLQSKETTVDIMTDGVYLSDDEFSAQSCRNSSGDPGDDDGKT